MLRCAPYAVVVLFAIALALFTVPSVKASCWCGDFYPAYFLNGNCWEDGNCNSGLCKYENCDSHCKGDNCLGEPCFCVWPMTSCYNQTNWICERTSSERSEGCCIPTYEYGTWWFECKMSSCTGWLGD
jgi:hypothetical protein